MAKTILFVDDEPYYAEPLVNWLEKAGYQVEFRRDSASGLDYLRANAENLGLVILDYMMPTPEAIPENNTLDGLATGRWFLRGAWDLMEPYRLPVLILSNRNIEIIRAEISEFDVEKVKRHIRIRHKSQLTRVSFLSLVEQILLDDGQRTP